MLKSTERAGLPFFQSDLLVAGGLRRHAFFGRAGGVSRQGELNLGHNEWDSTENVDLNLARARQALDASTAPLLLLNQVHQTTIFEFDSPDPPPKRVNADAIVIRKKNRVGLIRTADCIPLIYFHADPPFLALVHAGWRGVLSEMPAAVLQYFLDRIHPDPARLFVALGPAICRRCFEVGPEVYNLFQTKFPTPEFAALFLPAKPKDRIDLYECSIRQLTRLGLSIKNIDSSELCTTCRPDLFFSYRIEGNRRGSNGTMALLD